MTRCSVAKCLKYDELFGNDRFVCIENLLLTMVYFFALTNSF